MNVALDEIKIDAGLQNRARMDQTVIDEYASRMAAGDTFPPVTLVGEWLVDGFHRYYAARDTGRTEIEAEIAEGTTFEDASWHAISVNQTHGLRRTNADKRRATEIAIRHSRSADASNRAIAEWIGVSEGLVRRVRDDLSIPAAPVVVGRDGVSRNVEEQRGTVEPPTLPSAPTDSSGQVERDERSEMERWETQARDLVTDLIRIKRRILSAFESVRNDDNIIVRIECSEPGLASLPITSFKADLQNCIKALERNAIPQSVCPLCQGTACDSCAMRGWMSRNQMMTVPEELRS